MWFSCSFYGSACAMSQTQHASLMGIVIAAQCVLFFPLIFMAAMYDTFVTRRHEASSAAGGAAASAGPAASV